MEKWSLPSPPPPLPPSSSSSTAAAAAASDHVQPKAWAVAAAAADHLPFFRCPISMDIMEEPVTISTGVTYDRKNIEKWLHVYKKATCPATMQPLRSLHLTPNHTLARLISAFRAASASASASAPPPPPPPPPSPAELLALLNTIQSSPFKVNSLKKLRSAVAAGGVEVAVSVVRSGGMELLRQIVEQTSIEGGNEFADFRAAEEAVGVMQLLPLADGATVQALTAPGCMNTMVALLQRGSCRGRLHAVTLMQKMARTSREWCRAMADQDLDFYKSLVDLLSDGVSTLATSASVDVLTELATFSKRQRLRAVEAGACPVLIELLPTTGATRHMCERLLLLLKLLCECPDGRSAVTDHGMGVAAVSKQLLRVSDAATRLAVKIMWYISGSAATAKVVDDMMLFGAVKKLLALVQTDCKASTKQTAARILRLHGGAWRHYPCLSAELRDYLNLTRAS